MTDSIRVLHVEDESDFAALAAEMLEREDDRLAVETVTSAAEGLERLDDDEYDCIVSDYDMPGQNGISFLKSVREAHPDIPFILFTGKGGEEVASEAISAGVTDYLQKDPGTDQYALLANRIRNATDRTQAEAERERHERHFQAVLDDPNKLIGILDPDGILRYPNETAMDMVSATREEVIGKPFWETPWWSAEDRDAVREWVKRAADGEYVEFEAVHPGPDGGERQVEGTIRPTRNEAGEVGSLVASARDVTDRREEERELEERRNLIKTLSTALPDYLFIYDEEGRYLDVLTGWERGMELYSPQDLVGERVDELLPPDTADRLRGAITNALDTGELQTLEYPVPTETDEKRWYEGYLAPIPSGFDGQRAVILAARDVTARRHREQRLQRQTAQIEALHDVATDIQTSPTVDAVFDRVVRAAEQILEFDIAIADTIEGDVLVPKSFSSGVGEEEYFEETPVEAEDNLAARAFRTGEASLVDDLYSEGVVPASAEFRSALTVPIGDYGVFQTVDRSPQAFDETDLELVKLLVAHAKTQLGRLEDQRKLEEHARELERQNERLEGFTSVVSHDLRSPLNVAQGRLELAREECASEHLDAAERAIDRSLALVDDLLALEREGKRVDAVEAVDLRDVVDQCWETIQTADATLDVEASRQLRADRSRLKQLLENLFRNAIEHGGDDVTVTVGTLEDGFYVEDDGVGIPADEREQVFARGHTTAEQGTGFGLAIVNEIAGAHGWEVDATESDEGGTRFEITGVTAQE